MEKRKISDLLAIYLVIFLSLTALGSFFVFVINWEDWFFGIKLDGWPAGLSLFLKAAAAAALAYLLIKRENERIPWSILSILYFAFVFILPVFSIQRNMRSELGWTVFWIELALLIVVPSILLIVMLFSDRKGPVKTTPDR